MTKTISKKQRLKQLRKEFNEKCLKRDKHSCVICSSKEDLEVHHITDRKEMPNDGYSEKNGITLCPECHKKAELFHYTNGEKWVEGMSPDDLYKKIGTTKEDAIMECERL